MSELKVLFVEDSTDDVELCLRALKRHGYEPRHARVETPDALRRALAEGGWDIVLSDYYMPALDALDALAILRKSGAEIPFIVVTGSIDEETAVACIKAGADDYVLKDNLVRLGPAVESALKRFRERKVRQVLERRLREAEKMEALGRLAAEVAHEFNNLILVVLGTSELLEEALGPEHQGVRYVEGIRRAAQRASRLTRNLLGISRKSAGSAEVFDLAATAEDMARIAAWIAGREIQVQFSTVPEPCWVRGDPAEIDRVVLNLLLNAREAMPEGGQLAIRVGTESLSEGLPAVGLAPGSYGVLTVEDTGCGMPPEILERAFEPFFSTKEDKEGAGLGLSVAYGLARRSGGGLEIVTEPGHGTAVRVFLPLAEAPSAAATPQEEAPEASPGPPSGRAGILVLEDDTAVRDVVSGVLRNAGYTVYESPGSAGVESFLAGPGVQVDLVVIDLRLGDESGLGAARRLKNLKPDLRFLFTSGYGEPPAEVLERFGGSARFLPKPFSARQLLDTTALLLQEAPSARPERRRNRVLVIDDDPEVRRSLSEQLASEGYEVAEAEDGSEGLEVLEREVFDLVITDIVMPEKEGVELCLEIRRRFPETAVIAISGVPRGPQYLEVTRRLGAAATLLKPFSRDELLASARKALALRRRGP